MRRAKNPIWQTLTYAIKYTHAAAWSGDRGIYEAISKGVVITPLDDWFDAADDVAFGFNDMLNPFQSLGLSWAQGRYGTDGRTSFDFGRHLKKDQQ